MTSTASRISAASTKMPKRNFIACSFMVASSRRHRQRQLLQPFARLAFDELLHAGIGALPQVLRGAVKKHLRLAGAETAERMEHYDTVGDLVHGLHLVGDDDAGDRPALAHL